MAHKTTTELPDDVWEDIQKRRFRNEGGVKDLIVRAYRAHFMRTQDGAEGSRAEAETHSSGDSPPPAEAPDTAGPEVRE